MDIKFKLESNLQQMASIRVAANMWLSRPMIAKISNYVTRNDIELKSPLDNKIKIKIKSWLIDIFEQVDSMKLPDAIKNDLLYVMKPVGENLLDYLGRTSTKWNGLFKDQSFPGLDVYCKYIKFDCIGRVDEVKTFLNIYNSKKNVSLPFLFYEACTYCLEDVIHSVWNKCSEHEKFTIQLSLSFTLSSGGNNMHKIQQYWIQVIDKNQSMFPTKVTKIDAFKYCFEKANNVGVKYFINKLSQYDKNMIILPLAQKLMRKRIEGGLLRVAPSQNLKQHICNLFTLLAHMTEDNKKQFFILKKQEIILLLIKEWPWKYLLLDLDYFDKEIYDWLIKVIVTTIVDDYDFYKKIAYTDLWIISEIWKKNPNRFKESIAEICWSWNKPMMFKLEAITLVTSVIDDTDGVDKLRSEISKGFEKHCNKFIDRRKYEVVDLYLKNILQSDERKLYKALLQSKNICGRLLLFKYFDEFDRFLNWRFDNDYVQIAKFKIEFTADIVFITLLCRMLKVYETDFEMPIGILFLILDFDPSYQKQFKQRLIKNHHFKAHLRNCIKDDPKKFDHILSYFQFSPEEIVEIKKTFK